MTDNFDLKGKAMKKEIDLEEAFERGYFHDIYAEALRLKSDLELAKGALKQILAIRGGKLARMALAKLEGKK